MGFSPIYHSKGLQDTLLSEDTCLKMAPVVGTVGRAHIPRPGEEPPVAGSTCSHVLLMTFSSNITYKFFS